MVLEQNFRMPPSHLDISAETASSAEIRGGETVEIHGYKFTFEMELFDFFPGSPGRRNS